MSRLVKSVCKLTKLSMSNARNAQSLIYRNQLRTLSNTTTTPKPADNVAKAESKEYQWERSDRYKVFYGFEASNEAEDKGLAHLITFIGIFGFVFLPGFAIYFFPDYRSNDWCYREAHLELARREAAGEPLVNPDLVPVENIKLPSDEEIGEMEIVI